MVPLGYEGIQRPKVAGQLKMGWASKCLTLRESRSGIAVIFETEKPRTIGIIEPCYESAPSRT